MKSLDNRHKVRKNCQNRRKITEEGYIKGVCIHRGINEPGIGCCCEIANVSGKVLLIEYSSTNFQEEPGETTFGILCTYWTMMFQKDELKLHK